MTIIPFTEVERLYTSNSLLFGTTVDVHLRDGSIFICQDGFEEEHEHGHGDKIMKRS